MIGVAEIARWVWSFALICRSLVPRAHHLGRAGGRCAAGRLQQRRNLARHQRQGQPAGPAETHRRDGREGHGSAIADAGPAVQAGSRARGLEAGSLRPLCAAEDLSDLPLVGRPRTQGPRRRPPGAGRLLLDHAGADEPAVGLLPLVQHRLSQRLRPVARTHRLGADGAWRLLVARLLRDDRRADRGNLFAGPRIVLRRPEVVPVPGLSVPDDAGQHGEAPQQPEHAVLENDQGRLRSFRGDAAGAEGRFLREEIRVRCREGAGRQARSGVRGVGQMPGLCHSRRSRRRGAREAGAGRGRDRAG